MRILFIGASGTNAKLRVQALRDLGHDVTVLRYTDLTRFSENTLTRSMRLGAVNWVDRYVRRWLERHPAMADRYDLVFLNQPKIFGPRCYERLDRIADRIVNYVVDDPFGHRNERIWRLFIESVPQNDLLAVSHNVHVSEAKELGAPQVIRVAFPADPSVHRPMKLSDEERQKWSCDVLFLGTCMPERGPFMRTLIDRGVPLTINGNHWEKSPDWPVLRSAVRGGPLYGEDYTRAIQCAKIAIGLLSKGNRNRSTNRSSEIPAIGTLFCAERTEEHLAMYRDGEEAVFFDDAEECAERCQELLADDERRRRIAEAGHRRFLTDGTTNQSMLKRILDAAYDESTDAAHRAETIV